jgi:hypothetical protein
MQDFHSLGEDDPSWRPPRRDDENDPGGNADESADALVDAFGSETYDDGTTPGQRASSPASGEGGPERPDEDDLR